MTIAPSISVIVPHYDDLAGLDLCLAALMRQHHAGTSEVIVVDNATPVARGAIERVIAGRARLLIETERGAGAARNRGVEEARGTVIAFTDSDCRPQPGWLAAGVRALETFDIVGGAILVRDDGEAMTSGAAAFEIAFAFDNRRYVSRQGFAATANLFCRTRLFREVGGFVVGPSEDVEWCRRATAAGYRIGYEPRAVVHHPPRPDWPALLRKWRRIHVELYQLARHRPWGRLRWFARSWALPLSALAHGPRVLRHPELARRRARLAALATLFRLRLWRFADAHRLLLMGGRR